MIAWVTNVVCGWGRFNCCRKLCVGGEEEGECVFGCVGVGVIAWVLLRG